MFYCPTNIIAPSSYILEYFPFKSNWLIFSGVNVQWQNLVDLAKYVDWQWSLPSRRVTLWPLIAHICRSHHQIWIPDQFITCVCGTRPTFISKHKYAMLPYLRLKIEAKCVCNEYVIILIHHTSHISSPYHHFYFSMCCHHQSMTMWSPLVLYGSYIAGYYRRAVLIMLSQK